MPSNVRVVVRLCMTLVNYQYSSPGNKRTGQLGGQRMRWLANGVLDDTPHLNVSFGCNRARQDRLRQSDSLGMMVSYTFEGEAQRYFAQRRLFTDEMSVPESSVTIEAGYRPGLLARCLEMHIAYYHPINSWGLAFETSVGTAWADLIQRLNSNPRNQVFAAIENTTPDNDPAAFTQKIVGTILIDAESMKQPGMAQIRGFIVDERARGLGVGKRLLAAAMEFVEEMGFEKVSLYTARTQETSLFLYDKAGFVIVDDTEKDLWGWKMNELTLQWTRPAAYSLNDDNCRNKK